MELSFNRKRQRRLVKKWKSENRIDFVKAKFSKELVLTVFSFLSLQDLVHCTIVSTEWSRMANDEMLWKPLFFQRFHDPLVCEDRRSKFKYNRRASVTRYGGSWKTKYKIHHNWLKGNCFINDIKDISNNGNAQYLQFLNDIVFIAQSDNSIINVWKYEENNSTAISQLRAIENGKITFLKLIQDKVNHLVAGYSNGSFTLWKIEGSSSLDLKIAEIVNYTPLLSSSAENNKVTSIGMEYPMLLVCTESMKLSIFYVDSSFSLRLIHRLQSPVDWSPVVIDIHSYSPKKGKAAKAKLWKVIVCFGISGGNFTTSIGIQELILSSNAILSSKHGFALDFEPIYSPNGASVPSERITSMVYSPPHLITAHANNTMKQYSVNVNDCSLDISFKRTLYGHTFKVDALAVDASRRKLVSGDRSGIKIWDLSKQGECQVTLSNHVDQSKMTELPPFNIETLGFDEDKIVAIVNLAQESFVRLWSFNSIE